jgi:hypothetical protein
MHVVRGRGGDGVSQHVKVLLYLTNRIAARVQAARCGEILPGDVLLSVRESGDKDASAVGNKLEEAKALIMGPPGSVVILRFTRGETYQEHTHTVFEVSLVCANLSLPRPVHYTAPGSGNTHTRPLPPSHPSLPFLPDLASLLPCQRALLLAPVLR